MALLEKGPARGVRIATRTLLRINDWWRVQEAEIPRILPNFSSIRVLGAFRAGWCRMMSRAVRRRIAASN